jgi:hypothetical protein
MNIVEKRINARKNIDDIALVHINTSKGSIEKSARIDNISLGGICLKNIYTDDDEGKESYLEGGLAAVYFRSIPISIFGTVARQEAGGKVIVKIKQSTDDILWEKINI